MTSANSAVLGDNTSVKRAAITHGVPQTTLRQRVLGRVDPETTSSGPSLELNKKEEAVFVEHIKSMTRLGYDYTTNKVVSMASNYATFLTKCDEEYPFSRKYTQRKKFSNFFTSLAFVYKHFRIEQLCPSTDSMISLVFVHYAII